MNSKSNNLEEKMTDGTNVFQALIKRDPAFLDRPLADLLPLRFMGDVAVSAYRALIRNLKDLPLSLEEKESRLKDGQDAGKALLMIEARIGDLLNHLPGEDVHRGGHLSRYTVPGELEKAGFGRKDRHKISASKAIAAHPKEVAEVIDEAIQNEDIPTKTAVLNKIAYKKELARKKGFREATNLEMMGEAAIYLSKLETALHYIPTHPPKELREKDFLRIKAIAILILKRLEVFDEKKDKDSAGRGRRLSEGKR